MFKTLAVIVTLLVPATVQAQKRIISHDDVWLMHRAGEPALSPDGKQAVFAVTEPSYDSTQTLSDLWMVARANGSISLLSAIRASGRRPC